MRGKLVCVFFNNRIYGDDLASNPVASAAVRSAVVY